MYTIIKITPSGFCFGVKRAVDLLEKIIKEYSDKTIYCVHQIVHNPKVIKYFEGKGVKFIDDLESLKDKDAIVVFSAHGVDRFLLEDAKKKFFKVFNLECPFVGKVYNEAKKFVQEGRIIFYIGKKGHQEAENVISYVKNLGGKVYRFLKIEEIPKLSKDMKIGILNQTTLNYKYVENIINYVKQKFENVAIPPVSDICKATYERQKALKDIVDKIDCLIVIGGKNSSNTKELVKIGETNGKKVFHIETFEEINGILDKLRNFKSIGITGGASTPPEDIDKAYDFLKNNLILKGN